jgi:small subunit ribosomal protein S16
MAVKIRLTRKGKKKQPTYRVVVADSRAPRDGRYIEQIGRYDPRQEPSVVEIDTDRAQYWLGQGAQPSDAVRKLLEISGAVTTAPSKAAKAAPMPTTIHVVDEAAQVAAEAEEAEAAALAAAEVAEEVFDTEAEIADVVEDVEDEMKDEA